MLPIGFYIVLVLFFFILLTAGLYVVLTTCQHFFSWSLNRPYKLALYVNVVFFVFLALGRVFYPDVYRHSLDYLGVLSFAVFFALPYWLIQYAYRLYHKQWLCLPRFVKRWLGVSYIALTTTVVAYATYNFYKPEAIVEFEIVSDKVSASVKFVHISDIQYGTTSLAEMNRKLEKVFSLDVDFIVFTGDLVDFDLYKTEDFFKLAQSPVPIFFERGNHEFYHDPTRLLSDLNQVDTLRLLINEKDSIGEVDIVGIDYSRLSGHLAEQLSSIDLDEDRYSVLLYHEPVDIDVAAVHGFDLMLYGHTHGGQIWPYTWLVDWLYQYADGFYQVGESFVYTSDGLSLWGPRMRLGSQNEIVLFTINPQK